MQTFGGGALQRRPVAAVWLAQVSNSWATLEAVLAHFIDYMISERYLTNEMRMLDPLGNEIFGNLQTFRLRWSLLAAVLKARLSADEWKAVKNQLAALKRKTREAGEKRNEIVHSLYGVEVGYYFENGVTHYEDSGDDCLLKTKPYRLAQDSVRPYEAVSPEHLEFVVREINQAKEELESFMSLIQNRNSIPIPHTQAWVEMQRANARDRRNQS